MKADALKHLHVVWMDGSLWKHQISKALKLAPKFWSPLVSFSMKCKKNAICCVYLFYMYLNWISSLWRQVNKFTFLASDYFEVRLGCLFRAEKNLLVLLLTTARQGLTCTNMHTTGPGGHSAKDKSSIYNRVGIQNSLLTQLIQTELWGIVLLGIPTVLSFLVTFIISDHQTKVNRSVNTK